MLIQRSELLDRLYCLPPETKLTVILTVALPDFGPYSGPRQGRADILQRAFKPILATLERTLRDFEGVRLSGPDSLGCVVVRGNRACIEALASLPEVESIMENHEIKRLALEPSGMVPK